MNLRKILFLCFNLIVSTKISVAQAAQANDYLLWHERQAIDAAALDLDTITKSPDAVWVVGRIIPNPDNGHGEGMKKNPQTGDLEPIDALHPHIVVVLDGVVNSIAFLSGVSDEKSWTYRWEQEGFLEGKYIDSKLTQSDYMPFRWGGNVIVFKLVRSKVASVKPYNSQFAGFRVIPQEWQQYALPAVQNYRDNIDAFANPLTIERRAVLLTLLRNENCFISIAACRRLIQGTLKSYDKEMVETALKNSKGICQAALTILLLDTIPENQQALLIETISKYIDQTGSSEGLEGVATGTFSTFSAPKGRTFSNILISKLKQRGVILQNAHRKWVEFHTQSVVDSRLKEIFKIFGYSDQPINPPQVK